MQLFKVQKMLRGMEPLGELPGEKEVLLETIRIAWPSVLESFLIFLVSLIDMVMVGSLGAYAIAAVGLTAQPKLIGLAFFMSLGVAVSAIVARRRGEQDPDRANRVLVQSIMITLIFTVVISTLCVAFADQILQVAGSSEDTHEASAQYFRIIMGGMVFNVLSIVINAAQRGAGNTKIAMRTNIVSNLVNIVFNYLLIGGNLGFPKLGVTGAAIATVIGSVCACSMSIYSVMHKDRFISLRGNVKLRFDRETLGTLWNIGSSTLAEQIFLRAGFFIYNIVVAHLGTNAYAAYQVGMNVMGIPFALGDGLSAASVALVGRSLGKKREDLAQVYGGVCQRIGVFFSAILSVVFLLFGKQIFQLFSNEAEILDYGVMIMRLMTVIVFMQISQVIFSGCLRGAGDTKFVAFIGLVSVSFVRPFCGWLFCYPLALGLFGAWIGLILDQLVRFLMTLLRFRSGKWRGIKI